MKTLTLERLILSTLAEGNDVTAKDVASVWGEDVHRVLEWLVRFAKQGFCNPVAATRRVGTPYVQPTSVAYRPDMPRIRAAIADYR